MFKHRNANSSESLKTAARKDFYTIKSYKETVENQYIAQPNTFCKFGNATQIFTILSVQIDARNRHTLLGQSLYKTATVHDASHDSNFFERQSRLLPTGSMIHLDTPLTTTPNAKNHCHAYAFSIPTPSPQQ